MTKTDRLSDANFEIRPCVVAGGGYPDAHTTWFKVGNQSFPFGPDFHETKADAEWYVQMFSHALRTLFHR